MELTSKETCELLKSYTNISENILKGFRQYMPGAVFHYVFQADADYISVIGTHSDKPYLFCMLKKSEDNTDFDFWRVPIVCWRFSGYDPELDYDCIVAPGTKGSKTYRPVGMRDSFLYCSEEAIEMWESRFAHLHVKPIDLCVYEYEKPK